MGYGTESMMGGLVERDAQGTPIPTQTPADKVTWDVLGPITVHRIAAVVTTAITVADAIIALDRRVLTGSDTGRVELGRITIPVATGAIGKVFYKDIDPVDLDMGDQLVEELIQASTAGAVVFQPIWIPRAETPVNQPDAIKSA